MGSCSFESLKDPNTFCFQFTATFLTLFVLTYLSCTIGCTVKFIGVSIVLVSATLKITNLIRRLYFQETVSPLKKAVLVTGCDSGFGHRLANRLNSNGYTVYAACMDPNGAGPQQLLKMAAFPKATKLIAMNVTSDEDVNRALEEVSAILKKEGQTLWAIVNNAGIFRVGHVEWGPLEDYQKVFDVNVLGMARVTRAFLPLIRKSKGRVVNVASIAGRISGPGLAIYTMSKHAVVAFSTALRREMLTWGVKVSTIEPAIYKTPMADVNTLYDMAKKTWEETPESIRNDYGQEYFDDTLRFLDGKDGRDNPEEVVDAMVSAVTAVEPQIQYKVCGVNYAIIWILSDYLPFSIVDFISKYRGIKVTPKALV